MRFMSENSHYDQEHGTESKQGDSKHKERAHVPHLELIVADRRFRGGWVGAPEGGRWVLQTSDGRCLRLSGNQRSEGRVSASPEQDAYRSICLGRLTPLARPG